VWNLSKERLVGTLRALESGLEATGPVEVRVSDPLREPMLCNFVSWMPAP